MKTVALVDTNHGRGHHLTYMRFFSKTLLEMGYRVMSFYPQPDDVLPWIQENCPDKAENFYAFEMQEYQWQELPVLGRLPALFPKWNRWPQPILILGRWQKTAAMIQEAAKQIGHEPDLVFLNWLDNYLSYYLRGSMIDWVFPYPWSGLYFRPATYRFGQRYLPILKKPLSHLAVAQSDHCQAITLLDEYEAKNLQADIDNKPVIAFPDFTDITPPDLAYSLAADIKAKAGNRTIVGLFGALSKRKGLLTLLQAAQRCDPGDFFFVFAGSLSKAMFHQDYSTRLNEDYEMVQTIVESSPDNCLFHFEFIPGEPQFNALVNSCDVIFSAYENFPYSSNALVKAATFQKLVMASEGYCMGKRVQQFELGVTIPEGDVDACVEALIELKSRLTQPKTDHQPDFEGYCNQHSLQQLAKSFQDVLNLSTVHQQQQTTSPS